MDKYLITKAEIDAMPATEKQHFLNDKAVRQNKSLGDATGIDGFGFHIIEIAPGFESTEYHRHFHEDECCYVLAGTGQVIIGDETFPVGEGDFIGYRKGGLAHTMINTGETTLKCIVVGNRYDHDVGEYPKKNKRIYRNRNLPWELVDSHAIETLGGTVGKK